ncbi:MAG: universal stress protein, partial [Acidobacteriota bacterium]|nr:universal stress protein [Acidobacteriota bacterium]
MDTILDSIGFRGVFLPTDYTEAGQYAFYHGLKLAMTARVPLRLLHVDPPNTESSWEQFPKVRHTISRWLGMDHIIGVDRLAELGLSVRKSKARRQEPSAAILAGLKKYSHQLMVLAPHTHQGISGFFHKSVSSEVARKAGGMTLFVPEGSRGFVDPGTGAVNLKNILLPLDHKPHPQTPLDKADLLAAQLGLDQVNGHILHVGQTRPEVTLSTRPCWHWQDSLVHGDPVSCILEEAQKRQTRLIVMGTEGRHGLLDAFRGSVTERVVK